MDKKNRLYEIFAKVNKISLNEDNNLINPDEISDLRNDIEHDIKSYFNVGSGPKMFRNGIPTQLVIRIGEKDVSFVLNDEDYLKIVGVFPQQMQYDVIYTGDLKLLDDRLGNVDVKIVVPTTLEINKKFTGDKIEFYNDVLIDPKNVKVDFNEK